MGRIAAVFLAGFVAQAALAEEAKLDTAKIEDVTKLKGALNDAGDVFKVSAPRTDVKVTVDGSVLPPFMGLTSWAAFQKGTKAPAMVMGDLVLFEDEVNPALSALLDAGLRVTALHNHFFYSEPHVWFMHLGGEGTVEDLAKGVRAALDRVKAIRDAAPEPAKTSGGTPLPEKSSIAAASLEEILGAKGQSKDGMAKFVFGRTVKSACGCDAGKDMGVNTWAAFAGSDDNAMVDGDFAVLEGELQGVLKSLRTSGINIVAIHHHLTDETPRMLFLHYWGRGKAADLAKAVKAALGTLGR